MAYRLMFYVINVSLIVSLCFFALMIDWKFVSHSEPSQESVTHFSKSKDEEDLRNRLTLLMMEEVEAKKKYEQVNEELQLIKERLSKVEREKEADLQNTYHSSTQVKTMKNRNHTIHVKLPAYSDAKELILLVSSLGRGGSSWVAELLSNIIPETMYVFEPLKMIKDTFKTRSSPDIEVELLSRVFSCRLTEDFSNFRKVWPMIFRKFPDHCEGNNCFNPITLNSQCRKAQIIVSKTIRLPLADVEVLLNRPSFQHLKVIYLARDPRAQILSRREVFKIKKNDFTPECVLVDSDVFAFHRLSALFPGQFFFVRYEDLCLNPIEEASQLWKFLSTNSTASPPSSWMKFLKSHDTVTAQSAKTGRGRYYYSTYRNSSSQWYKWREDKNITTESLVNIESLCSASMDRLGYIPLKNAENVKNLSLPFIKDYNCDFWNCWTHRF